MEQILQHITSSEDILVPFIFGTVVALWIVFASITKVCVSCFRERTKRDIAAYIAEGSISPEQGERLITAGRRPRA